MRWSLGPLLLCVPALACAQAAASGPRVAGYVQARETLLSGAGLTATINRARVGVSGTAGQGFFYKVTAELASGGSATTQFATSLRDAYAGWRHGGFSIQAGQFKTPFSGQYVTSLTRVETADRAAVVDALAPKRDIGLMAAAAWGERATVALGVFNGEGQNIGVNRDSSVLLVARVTVRPVGAVTLGADLARYRDSTRYGLEGAVAYVGFGLKAEYLAQHRPAVGRDDWGYYLLATYWLLPDLQLVAEQEDFERPSVPAFVRNTAWAAGANLWAAAGRVRLLAEYVSRAVGPRRGAVVTQLQLEF